LTEKIFEAARRSQQQRIELQSESAKREDKRNSMNLVFGAIIVVVGYGVSAYLALNGQKDVALTISTPLTALVAVVMGRRLEG